MRQSKCNLKNIRVLKKNMLFIQSYDEQINKNILNNKEAFEVFGKVESIKIKQNYKNHTAYITFQDYETASTAFITFFHINQKIKILFGTVQYCKYFIRKSECRNQNCVFLHVRDKKNQIYVIDEIQENVYKQHYQMAIKIAKSEYFDTFKQILKEKLYTKYSILERGILKTAQEFNLLQQPVKEEIAISPMRKPSQNNTQCLGQSTDGSLNQLRQDGEIAQSKEKQLKKEQQLTTPNSRSNFSFCDYINIRLIKKLIRQNRSKMHKEQQSQGNRQQIHARGKLMLYKVVKK